MDQQGQFEICLAHLRHRRLRRDEGFAFGGGDVQYAFEVIVAS